jgi:hypothetical protein
LNKRANNFPQEFEFTKIMFYPQGNFAQTDTRVVWQNQDFSQRVYDKKASHIS